MLRAVLAYLELGYAVLPLAPGEKRPHSKLVPNGLKQATQDPRQVAEWWRQAPDAGVGLLPPEGVLVLDIDQPELVEELLRRFDLHEAPRQRTPRRGAHLFLKLPPGVALSASTKALPGVDLRGMGRAYVVSAPTTLPSGKYAWERSLTPPEDLPEAPKAFLEALTPPPPPPRATTWTVGQASPRRLQALLLAFAEAVAAAPKGTRHLTLVRYSRAAGGLIPHGLAREEAMTALLDAGLRAGLPEAEARAVVEWGLDVGAAAPLVLDTDTVLGHGGVLKKAPSGTAKTPFLDIRTPKVTFELKGGWW